MGGKPLKLRTAEILKVLVDEYIRLASPIASEDLARRSPFKVSAATIRNEMAGLEEGGYIHRPHVSAGGVPSDKGYRFYVESLEDAPEPPESLQRQIRDQFSSVQLDPEAWIQLAAAVLSRMVDNVAIVTIPREAASRVKHLQLVYVQEFLALLIVVLQEARLRQHLLPLEEPTSQTELTETANRLNEQLSGHTYSEIAAKQLELDPFQDLVKENTIAMLKEVDNEAALEHSVDGLRLLLSQPEFAEGRRAQALVELLEERVLLRSILMEAPGQGATAVYIGEENQQEALRSYSVVLSGYGATSGPSGTIGVIGPTRMEYPTIMGGIRFLSACMSDLLIGVRGR